MSKARHILITGAGGMLGRKLHAALSGPDVRFTLADVVAPEGSGITACDLSEAGVAARLVADKPDVIYHLAAVVSGEAEADLAKGYRVNLTATQALLEAVAAIPEYCPRFVFTSSLAVFSAPLPDVIPDDQPTIPLSSYGAQKAMGEILVNDFTRKGVIDGITLRLPTICIRPGKPNAAASGFYSSILREPLEGQEAVLPVPETLRHWFASPRAAVGMLVHAGQVETNGMGHQRALNLPGVSATVADMLTALEAAAGPKARALVRANADPAIEAIVGPWPKAFDPKQAMAMGFSADESIAAILRAHIEDELGG